MEVGYYYVLIENTCQKAELAVFLCFLVTIFPMIQIKQDITFDVRFRFKFAHL